MTGPLSQEEIDALLRAHQSGEASAGSDSGEAGSGDPAAGDPVSAGAASGSVASGGAASGGAASEAAAPGAGPAQPDEGSVPVYTNDEPSAWPPPPAPPSPEDLDVLAEVANIAMGSAATAASELMQRKVIITAPTTKVSTPADVWAQFELPTVVVEVSFIEGLRGRNLFILRPHDAAVIADLMMGNDGRNPPEELDELALSAVAEAMNQMMGSSSTAMSEFFNLRVNISPPEARLTDAGDRSPLASDEPMVAVSFWLRVDDLIDSNFVQLMPFPFAMELIRMAKRAVGALDDDEVAAAAAPPATAEADPAAPYVPAEPAPSGEPAYAGPGAPAAGEPGMAGEPASQPPARKPENLLEELEQPEPVPTRHRPPVEEPQTGVQSHGIFPSFDEPEATEERVPSHPLYNVSLELIRHIPVEVGVTLGHAEMSVRDVLRLTTGALVQLNTHERDLVSIHANGVEIARGEVVVVGEKYGVRITDIVDPARRLSSLQR